MLKDRLPSLPALGAGVLAVLVHPSDDARFTALLAAYVALGSFAGSPVLAYLLPIAGAAGFELYCMATLTTRFNNEIDFAAFILAAVAWAALLGAGRAATPRRASLSAAFGAGATAAAFGFMLATDRLVAFYAPFSRRDAFADPLHLTQLALCAIVLFLGVWAAVSLGRRRRGDKLLAYAEGYVACRRELERLGKRHVT